MAIRFRLDTVEKCVFGKSTSEVSNADVLEYQRMLAAHPDHGAGFDMLLDLRAAQGDLVTTDGLREASYVAEQFAPFLERCKCAVVVSTQLAFGMSRVFQALSSRALEVQVFYEVVEARSWLGLPLEGDEPLSRAAQA